MARTGPRAVKPCGTKSGYKQFRSEVVDCCRHGAVVHCAHYCSVNIGHFHGGIQNCSPGRWPAAGGACRRAVERRRHAMRRGEWTHVRCSTGVRKLRVCGCHALGHAGTDVLRSRSTRDRELRGGGCHVLGRAGTVVLRPTIGVCRGPMQRSGPRHRWWLYSPTRRT